MAKTINEIVKETIDEVMSQEYLPLCEGIDFNTYNNTVKFTDDHEDNVDTSLENNPVKDTKIVKGINVWSIFKRKKSPFGELEQLDGNPLLYALKNIDGWKFISNENRRAFEDRLSEVIDKFLSMYQSDITVVVPSGGVVNEMLVKLIRMKSPQTFVVRDVMRKLSCWEVWHELSALDSPFRKKFGKTETQWKQTVREMTSAFIKMKLYRQDYFTYHFTPEKYRDAITTTLAKDETSCAQYITMFHDKNILILDDSISRGATIKNACNIIKDFSPKSITVLTMFSKKYRF